MKYLLYSSGILLLTLFGACNNSSSEKCKDIREWSVQNYRIVESRCPDLVLAFYNKYNVYAGGKLQEGVASQIDSCLFTWNASNESFFRFNVCDNAIQELKPNKIPLDIVSIDSVIIFSNELKQVRSLTRRQVEKLVNDWNNSTARGYSNEPFDSAFLVFPAYQYKLTVFSKDAKRLFYGYNYLMLDSSGWKFKMNKSENLEYFHDYW